MGRVRKQIQQEIQDGIGPITKWYLIIGLTVVLLLTTYSTFIKN